MKRTIALLAVLFMIGCGSSQTVHTATPKTTTTTAPLTVAAPATTTAVPLPAPTTEAPVTDPPVEEVAPDTTPETAPYTAPVTESTQSQAAYGQGMTVNSTAYCDSGTTASGQQTHEGGVAMNIAPLGSVWQVVGGGTYTVNDHIGSGSDFDIYMSDCGAAENYGRRTVDIVQVG